MRSPFPGMDPYLEHPALWPDVHNSLLAAIRDALSPVVAPDYYVGLERRAYLLTPDDVVFVGRPDVSVASRSLRESALEYVSAAIAGAPVWVDVPMSEEVEESYLEIHEVLTGRLVTILELLSPANKLTAKGRQQYEEKRAQVLLTRTNLVEVDLLRSGRRMPYVGQPPGADYGILVSRGWQRPRAQLFAFGVRNPIPAFTLPLMRGEPEPEVNLNGILHALYERARFDLRLDYTQPAVPPLADADAAWAAGMIAP